MIDSARDERGGRGALWCNHNYTTSFDRPLTRQLQRQSRSSPNRARQGSPCALPSDLATVRFPPRTRASGTDAADYAANAVKIAVKTPP